VSDTITGKGGRHILVTGGLGFIGSFVTESIVASGNTATVVDSCVSSVIEADDLQVPSGTVEVATKSVEDYLVEVGNLDNFDMVVHCASYVGPASILGYAGQLGPAIVSTTAKVIEKCLAADIPLVNFSSAEIYGKSGILREDGDIRVPPYFNPRIEYALGKLTAEAMCINSKHSGLRSATIRPFNVAGPRQSRYGGFVMPTFVQQALEGRPMTVFASGRQRRAFLSVFDLCRFIHEHLTDEAFDDPKVYNVGAPGNTTEIYDLAARIKTKTGSESDIIYADATKIYGPQYEEAESFEKLPELRNAAALGWQPRMDLDWLIEETITYYKSHSDLRGANARL
jgi:nucleoside-diphosphate-sugar epimerase